MRIRSPFSGELLEPAVESGRLSHDLLLRWVRITRVGFGRLADTSPPRERSLRCPRVVEEDITNAPLILRTADATSIDRGSGIRSIPLVGGDTGAERLLAGVTVLPPGASIPLHTHSSEEFILILEGDAMCELEEESHRLAPLDATYVPAGIPHRFLNVGDGPMRILWVYTDVDTTRTLVASGETLGHLDSYPDEGS